MIRKAFKIGDIITIKRTFHAGTGYRYALVRLSGGIAFIGETTEESDRPGEMSVQSFSFQFLSPGAAEIQFAYFRDVKEILYEDVFPYMVAPEGSRDTVLGGWGEYETVTEKDKEIFDACMTIKGVEYIPIVVAKQLVNGEKMRFFCMTKTITLNPVFGFALVEIYAPFKGEPRLESIINY